jgi:selenide,water dikinase
MSAGIYSTMHTANARSYASLARGTDVDESLREILFDPQTSGGLLLGIAPEAAVALRETLRERGYLHAQIIGTVAHRDAAAAPVVTVQQNRAFAAEP